MPGSLPACACAGDSQLYGYGKAKPARPPVDPDDPDAEPFWDDLGPDDEVWAVMEWFGFDDGHRRARHIFVTCGQKSPKRSPATHGEMEGFTTEPEKDSLDLLQCFDYTEDDLRISSKMNYPNYQSEPDPSDTDNYDVYHARLKVMEELQPKTVALLKIANGIKDPEKRKIAEREAVRSYFAELAHYFTREEIDGLATQQSPRHFLDARIGQCFDQPRRTLDPVNHELALNWLREKYNEDGQGAFRIRLQ